MSGFVYFLRRADGDIKIGWASNVARRVAQLRCKLAEDLEILGSFPGSFRSEALLHDRFSADRRDGEWFAASSDLLEVIRESVAGAYVDPAVLPELPLSTIYDLHETSWTADDAYAIFRPLLSEMIVHLTRSIHRLSAYDQVSAACGVSTSWLRKFMSFPATTGIMPAHTCVNILAAYKDHQHRVRADAVEAIRVASIRQADAERALAFLWPSSISPAADEADLPLWRALSGEE